MAEWRKAVHCRNRAELLRTIADHLKEDEHRLSLHDVASRLDNLAAALEKRVAKYALEG